jgi:hypothetical protein
MREQGTLTERISSACSSTVASPASFSGSSPVRVSVLAWGRRGGGWGGGVCGDGVGEVQPEAP